MSYNKIIKELPFREHFEKFIHDSKTGKRFQANGKQLSKGTIENYQNALRLISKFSEETKFTMRLRKVSSLNKRELIAEKNYWNKFQKRFTDYLYRTCGHFDNYVGSVIKAIKTFFAYLNKGLGLGVGEFYKNFYVRIENNPLLVLLPEELNFFIYNKEFEDSLSFSLKTTKDFFVFGCTVALRFSDLILLQRKNLLITNDSWYLQTKSKKTGTDTMMKLPDYAISIIKKYLKGKSISQHLLPTISNTNLNKNIKKLIEKAGCTRTISKTREKRGVRIEIFKVNNKIRKVYRMCDLVSTHTMRRTAITTMLSLGMPEQLVRKISGHTPGSKDFYKYMFISQSYLENETNKVFDILKEKKLQISKERQWLNN